MFRHRGGLEIDIWELLFSLVMIRFVLVAMMLVLLAPREDPKPASNRDRGTIRVEIDWPTGMDVDIDLWVQAPGDRAVGWSNKGGKVFDLVRDDLGNINNPSGQHYEISYARGAPPGEYIVNVHYYNSKIGVVSVPVDATIAITKDDTGKGTQENIATKHLVLTELNEEQTVLRFTLDAEKNVVSTSTVYKPIYRK
jgi:hypothetical protein